MTEVQEYQSTPVAMVDYQSQAIGRLAEWAASAQAAYEVARRIVGTSFVPAAYKGKPDEATAAILAGLEVGLSPMSALKAFDVIQGQAAPRAITLRAIVQSHGHDVKVIESTNARCTVEYKRRDWNEPKRLQWTIDQARELGLLSRDQWKKQPQTMLVARATSAAARLVAADAILGIAYSAEELADGADPSTPPSVEPDPAAVPASPSTGTKRMSRKSAPAPEPEPENQTTVEESEHPAVEQSPAEPVAKESPAISSAQMKMLQASFKSAGIEDRDERLAHVSTVIGREVGSANDLTRDEASRVIEWLSGLDTEPGSAE